MVEMDDEQMRSTKRQSAILYNDEYSRNTVLNKHPQFLAQTSNGNKPRHACCSLLLGVTEYMLSLA
jgi:hypothetical protein